MAVCTGCSLLCDDIEFQLSDKGFSHVKNLCRKGHAHFQALLIERAKPSIDGKEVSFDQALNQAVEILKNAKKPLFCGLSQSSSGAQTKGLDLAKGVKASMIDPSFFCLSALLELVMVGKVPTCTLDDVRNYGDTTLFWGADPSNSHPRLLSRFAYYPRGEKRQKSYEEERICVSVDVRKSSTSKLCANNFFRLSPGQDSELLNAILAVLDGKIPRLGDKKRMIELGQILRKTEFGIIFAGSGLVRSLSGRLDLFERLILKLNEISSFKVIPMLEQSNTRGLAKALYDNVGFVNRFSFNDGTEGNNLIHNMQNAAESCDACLSIGVDALSKLPKATAKTLSKVPLIAIDPHQSMTTDLAKVVIPSAIYGLEAGGVELRMDGVKMDFESICRSDLLTDEQILTHILEAI